MIKMGHTPIPSRAYLKAKEKHDKVKKQLKELEKTYLGGERKDNRRDN